ncbi:hypothetical protein D9613_011868 [Agrocybe pediades]|uniref:F-box domain-containing protein n=1 Tax=Agrocybe pediades TaxID=84607 RepID=A0A8H4QLR9_9AGAR|nr:hypothetical protein D9613_011868 [Agrocybe pediades]
MHNYAIASTGRILPPELLLEVFMQNAAYHETDDWPIDTTLNCSQVCKLWRMIILGCSSLWGRLMQVHMFEGMQRSWTETILSRTGNGSLWVHGFLSLDTHYVLQYLVDKWENVETMNVEECATVRTPPFNWSFLLKEAPNLQSLSVFPFQPTPLSGSPLFNNVAPEV